MIAAIVPRNNRRNGNPFLIDKYARFTHAGDANGRDVGRAGSSVDCRPKRFNRSSEQLLGGEFDTEGRGDPWSAGPALTDDLTLIGEDDRFCRGGPDIKAYENCHVQNLRGYRLAIG